MGLTVDKSAYEDATLTLTFKGAAGEAHLEAYGQLVLNQAPSRGLSPGNAPFEQAVAAAPGKRVVATEFHFAEQLRIELEGGLTLIVSLLRGTYPGESAVYLKGPGKSYVNFNENGFARLTL